jgi:hypothetical protein
MNTPKPPSAATDLARRPQDLGLFETEQLLRRVPCLSADADWLAATVLRVIDPTRTHRGALPDSTSWRLEQFLRDCAPLGERDAGLLTVLALISGGKPPWRSASTTGVDEGWSLGDRERRGTVAEFLAHGLDVHRALACGWPPPLLDSWQQLFDGEDSPPFATMRRLLLEGGVIDLPRLIPAASLRRSAADGWHPPSGSGSRNGAVEWNDGVTWKDPAALRVWIVYEGAGVLGRFRSMLADEPEATLLDLARGILRELLSTAGLRGHHQHYLNFADFGLDVRSGIRPLFEALDQRLSTSSPTVRTALRELWLIYFRLTFDGDPTDCPETARKQALSLARDDLERLRRLFRDADASADNPAAREFLADRNHFDTCCTVLARHGSIWQCLKPLLLSLRQLKVACVARDLRFWHERWLEPVPTPWSHLPEMMAVVIHSLSALEQARDADLEELRSHFATFCLERLVDSKQAKQELAARPRPRTDEDLVERVPAWRYCLIRAVADLRANPEGRGHRTLHWSSTNDPDPTVRAAAQQAYHTIRHVRGLPERVSPRRAVMSALWWLRQAHLLGLGIEPDHDLAQRTREKELTRVKEAERDVAPPQDM